MSSHLQRSKNLVHRLLDPLLARRSAKAARRALAALVDGVYTVPVDVPYVAQFASPQYIYRYIYEGFHGRDDPAWESFGAPDPDTYDFWARRSCALACLKMAVTAFDPRRAVTLWDLVQQGLAYDGYQAYDQVGRLVDEGWFYHALVSLAGDYGLRTLGHSYVSVAEICRLVLDGWLVAPAVTPELGERGRLRRYGGHMVLVYGFRWQAGQVDHLLLHNPSGRFPDLQAHARIPVRRFARAFAHRLVAFRADSR